MPSTVESLNQALGDRYAIEREIGQGGMATVFLARDRRHDRPVAVKLLRPDLGAVVGAERFLAEIRVTANLQHPNLLPLFDSGATDGSLFYVMPYVDGESLRHRLDREKQIPVDEALRLTIAIAGALDYAHRQGVIHRDLKPENILLQAGQPVVADFGIALAIRNAGGARITQTGLSLGTPQYMSPEQATGDRVIDARSDVYSLGAMLYEMLTGDPPHTGSTAQAIIARLLTEAPRAMRLTRPSIPEHVEAAVSRALEKLPADRFEAAGSFADALAHPGATSTRARFAAATGVGQRGGWHRAAVAVPWVLLVLAVAAGVPAWFRPAEPVSPVVAFQPNIAGLGIRSEAAGVISPDGSMIVFPATDSSGTMRLWVQSLDRNQPVALDGGKFNATTPFFSPDGKYVATWRDAKLVAIAVAGGSQRVICDVAGSWQLGSWSEKGDIVFGFKNDLWRVRAEGGEKQMLVRRDSAGGVAYIGAPHFLPGGEVVLAERVDRDGPELIAVELATGAVRPLGIKGLAPHYVDGGQLVYMDGSVAFAVPFDARRLRATGAPVRLLEGVAGWTARLSVSRNGSMMYFGAGDKEPREVTMIDRSGRRQLLPIAEGRYRFPRFSPDGSRLVIIGQRPGKIIGDVWTYDFASGRTERQTFDTTALVAEWAPDGRSIYYTRRGELYRINTSGGGIPERTATRPGGIGTPAFAPDGRTMVYAAQVGANIDLFITSLDSAGDSRALAESPLYSETGTAMSPDGKWVAYSASADGKSQVYVRRLRGDGQWLASTDGGSEPRWGANGRELFYRSGDSLRVVSFDDTGTEPRIGQPRALFEDRYVSWPTEVHYDVSRDGQKFVFVTGTNGGISLNVVLHRLDALRRR